MRLSPGDRLGFYEILAPLGAGGMGEVFRAKDTKLGRHVAIKVLPAQLAANTSARERLRREAAASAALNHPFICKVFEIGESNDVLFVVMELITGETLQQRLRAGRLELGEALRVAAEVAEALEEAHNNCFVHRDLKPANVMIAQGHVKVMDFGLAKQFGSSAPPDSDAPTDSLTMPVLTELGTAVGTPDYMSPEQAKGEPLDQRSDLFSYGILLCDLLGNPHPFRRTSTPETMAAILRDPPNLSGRLPEGLMLMIRRLLAKHPDHRYQSMADVRADLSLLSVNALSPENCETHADRIPLIGRDAERKELLARLDEALSGHGSMVMIGGEPGVGKTHLTKAILEEARQRGAYTNVGHCYEMEGSPSYVPFIEMLERTAMVAPKAGFRRALGEEASEIAKLMPELRRMYPDIPEPIQLPQEQQRRYLFNAYRDYVERAARNTPVVLVFEDLHWADEPTLLLLQHLAQLLPTTQLLIIGTYRDVELEVARPFAKTLETMLRKRYATRISLRRLTAEGVESMLAALSGQIPPPSLARVVFAETEGNPFFVEEVFRHLAEEGKLFDDTGKWRPGLRADELHVPESVRLVLGRRLDRLGSDARRILTTAAVIGRTFSLSLLEALENAAPDAALDAMEEAEGAHLVAAEPAGREARYRFVHELVRQTLADTLSLPRRQRLHARVADAIERVYTANLEPQSSQLAHHLYQAGAAVDLEKTSKYLVMAAQKARAGAAHEEALAHLEAALSIWEGAQDLRVAELTLQRAKVLRSLGRLDEAIAAFRCAIALFRDAGAVTNMARASLMLAVMLTWRLELAESDKTVETALACLGSVDPELRLSLLSTRAAILCIKGDTAEAGRLRVEAGAAEDAAAMAFYLNSMQWERAATLSRQLADSCRARGDLWGITVEWGCQALAHCGQPTQAARDLPGSMQLAEKVGHHNVRLWYKSIATFLAAARGDLRQAQRDAEDAWKFGETHNLALNFVVDVSLGVVAFLRGDPSEAERWLRYRPEPRTHYFGLKDSSLFALLAETATDGDDERAWKVWNERRWELPKPGQLNSVGSWQALERTVVGLASLGRKEEVAALRPLAEELVRPGVWVSYSLVLFRTVAGIAAACAGDWPAAEKHHRAAIHQAETAPYTTSQPMAREWYARMLLDRDAAGDRARAHVLLAEALATYEAIGMPFHIRRTSARLAGL